MSTALNDRDAILQAASVRVIYPKNARVLLDAVPLAFHMNSAGDLDVPAMTINASLMGLEGDVTFAAEGATLTQVTGKSATVRYVDMQGPLAMVTASIVAGGETFSQGFLVSTLRDGAAGGSGSRGAGFYRATGNAWSDGIADAATPGGNVVGDIVIISNGVSSWPKEWDGSKWFYPGAFFPGSLLVEKSVLATHLGAESVTAEKIAAGAVKASSIQVGGDQNNLIRDPRFKDLAWWGLDTPGSNTNVTVRDWTGTSQTAWKHNASVYLQSTGGAQYDTTTQKMPMVPGATYLIEYSLYFPDDWDGDISIWWHVAHVHGNTLGGAGVVPDSPHTFSNGSAIQYPAYTRGWQRISAEYTVPNVASATESSFIILRSIRSGAVEIGGFNLIRQMDSVLIKDGAITANKVAAKAVTADKIDVVNLSAASSVLGDVLLGPNGALHQGTNAYNSGTGVYLGAPGNVPKFFAGTAGGANIRWSPEEGLRVDQASLESYAAWLTGSAGGSYPNGSAGYGFLQANVSGGKAPYTYRWTLTVETKTGNAGNMVISSTTSQSASFSGSGTNATLTYTVTCAVTDGNQRTIVLGTSINANHGTPP